MKNKALFTSQKGSWSISRIQCSTPLNQVDKLVGKETLKSWLSLQQINCHAERAQPNSHVSCCYVHEMSAAEAMEATAHARWISTVKCYTHRLIKTQIRHARDFAWYRGQRPSPARVILSHERVQIHARENLCSYATNPLHFRVRELLLCDI